MKNYLFIYTIILFSTYINACGLLPNETHIRVQNDTLGYYALTHFGDNIISNVPSETVSEYATISYDDGDSIGLTSVMVNNIIGTSENLDGSLTPDADKYYTIRIYYDITKNGLFSNGFLNAEIIKNDSKQGQPNFLNYSDPEVRIVNETTDYLFSNVIVNGTAMNSVTSGETGDYTKTSGLKEISFSFTASRVADGSTWELDNKYFTESISKDENSDLKTFFNVPGSFLKGISYTLIFTYDEETQLFILNVDKKPSI